MLPPRQVHQAPPVVPRAPPSLLVQASPPNDKAPSTSVEQTRPPGQQAPPPFQPNSVGRIASPIDEDDFDEGMPLDGLER